MNFALLFFLPLSLILSCTQPRPESNFKGKEVNLAEGTWEFPYNIDQADQVFPMPGRLVEISGLSMSLDGNSLLAVNDEEGEVFIIDPKTGEVDKDEIDFKGNGDYEGLEAVGNAIYVVKSNGRIYEVTDLDEDDPDTEEFNNFLDGSNNVEGLAYDSEKNQLLLACKGFAGEDIEGQRAIYAWDISKKELLKDPVYTISRNTISNYFKAEGVAEEIIQLMAPDQAADAFAPSGIAVHPHTRQIYIVASQGKMLVVLSPTGKIEYMKKLSAEIIRQPEGICFDQNGTLYIASEGKGNRGKIFVFKPL